MLFILGPVKHTPSSSSSTIMIKVIVAVAIVMMSISFGGKTAHAQDLKVVNAGNKTITTTTTTTPDGSITETITTTINITKRAEGSTTNTLIETITETEVDGVITITNTSEGSSTFNSFNGPCSAEQPCVGPAVFPCDDGEGQYTEDDRCNRIAVCLDATDEKNCPGTLPYFPSSYFQEDTYLYGRNDVPYPPSTPEERKAALAFVRQLLPATSQESPISDDTRYYQGDIILRNIEELDELLSIPHSSRPEQHHVVRRVAPHEVEDRLWPNGQVPYQISNKFSPEDRTIILGAIGLMNERIPCLNVIDRVGNENYVHILNNKTKGCNSLVGRYVNNPGQDLNLGNGCVDVGRTIHELMHAVGFWHEQSRRDREKHVEIIEKNIKTEPIDYKHNFRPHANAPHLQLPYDFLSLMHYEVEAFSKNGENTIKAIKGQEITGQRVGMEPLDELGLRLLYKCGSYPEVEGCNDGHDLCDYWASTDGCTDFPEYMNAACKKACNMCAPPPTSPPPPPTSPPTTASPPTSPPPTASPPTSPPPTASPPTAPPPSPPTASPPTAPPPTTPPPTTAVCFPSCKEGNCTSHNTCTCNAGWIGDLCQICECIDKNFSCKKWSLEGECERNSAYMLTNCAKSCKQCQCIDKNYQCEKWGIDNECKKNPAYMLYQCPLTCKQCVTTETSHGSYGLTSQGTNLHHSDHHNELDTYSSYR